MVHFERVLSLCTHEMAMFATKGSARTFAEIALRPLVMKSVCGQVEARYPEVRRKRLLQTANQVTRDLSIARQQTKTHALISVNYHFKWLKVMFSSSIAIETSIKLLTNASETGPPV